MQTTLNVLSDYIKKERFIYFSDLQPGLSLFQIQASELKFERTLPKSLKLLYQWKNGQREDNSEAFINNAMFLPLEEALETAAELTSMIKTDFEMENWWHPAWIPIFHNGSGSYICYDSSGVFTGKRGQIIEFWKEDSDRDVIAPHLESLLKSLIRLYSNIKPGDEFFTINSIRNYPKRYKAG